VALNARRVPARAILVGSLFGFVAVTVSVVSPTGVFAFLVNASGALMLMIYLLVAFAQLQIRRTLESEHPERLTIRMWGYPWLTWIVIAAIVAVLASMALRDSSRKELAASVVSLGVVVLACVVRLRRRPLQATIRMRGQADAVE
jgi:L-asparagine transporter-like permease